MSRLYDLLSENTTITVDSLALSLDVSAETAVKLLRQERAPMFVRGGVLWARGRKPSRRPPSWLNERKSA